MYYYIKVGQQVKLRRNKGQLIYEIVVAGPRIEQWVAYFFFFLLLFFSTSTSSLQQVSFGPENSPCLLIAQAARVRAASPPGPKRLEVIPKRAPRLRAYKSPRTDVPQSPGNFY